MLVQSWESARSLGKKTGRGFVTLPQVLVALAVTAAIVLAGCAGAPGSAAQTQAPKNIIIMFADGTAATQWELGKYSARHLRNEDFAVTDVIFREGAVGMLSTHSLDAIVTDSAAAASAMSTGHKVNNYAVSTGPDGAKYPTLMQVAKAQGKRMGLVTTATVYDASPAAFSVNAPSRSDYQSIVDQYLALEPDVLMGGGADFFLPATVPSGKRKDGRDVIAAFAAKGHQVVYNPAQLKAATGSRLLGLFAAEDMELEIDRDAAREPSTAEMAAAALKALSQSSPNGFVLLVENENTDTAGHRMDAAALVRALWAFDKAVQVALDFQRKSPNDTLLIVTGDHETGGLSPTYALKDLSTNSSKNRYFAGIAQLQMLDGITMSLQDASDKLGKKPSPQALDALLAKHFPGFRLDPDLREAILKQQMLERNYSYVTESALSRMVSRQTGIFWGTSGHTPEPVLVGAIGPGSVLFRGYQDNTEFGRHLQRLINGR